MDGVWGAAHYGITSPLGFVEQPELNAAAISLDAGASTQGSYSLMLDAQAPAYWSGWRLGLTLTAFRANRLGFYGLGNDTPFTPDSVTGNAPYFYRVSRTTAGARLTIQRRVIGPLRVLAGASVDRTDFRMLPGGSVFRADVASGAVDSSAIPFADAAVHAGLVLDTRDNELAPHAGVLVEGLYASGSGYTRTTGSMRVYAHPLARLVLAGRITGEGMGGNPPLAAQLSMESSERAFVAVGGYHSLRGLYDARFVGPGKLLGGAEARYALLWAPSVLEVMLVGFLDAGRVFAPGERFRVTTTGLHTGGGGEVAVRFLRNSLLVIGAASGGEGTQLVFGTQWSY
jgi:outer membrane protein assembly factor BamA